MTDREKRDIIIREFERFIQEYDRDIGFATHDKEVLMDALALLKAQEPVEPKKNDVELAGLRTWDWACPKCNCILTYRANYCSCCGRAVKWE